MLSVARDKNRTSVKGGRRNEQVGIGQQFAGFLKFCLDIAEHAEQGASWLQLIENIREAIHPRSFSADGLREFAAPKNSSPITMLGRAQRSLHPRHDSRL